MFSDVSDRTPRKVRIASETTAMMSLLETGCLPPLGSVVGCVADCVVGRVVAGVADCVAASFIRFVLPSIRSFSVLPMGWPPVVPIVFRLLPVVGVLLHESQGFGQGAYRGFALVRGQPTQQLAQMRVIFLHIDAADI